MKEDVLPYRYRTLAQNFTASRFAMFHNPANRGENFRWKNFADLVTRMGTTELHLYFSDAPSQRWKELFGKEVHAIATRLVELQGDQNDAD